MVILEEKSFEELHLLALKTAANIHLQDDVEHGRSIDRYGNVKKFTGDKDSVRIDITQDTRITVHNHPHDYKIPTTFSSDDVYHFIAKKQLLEIITCGYGYYFYLQRGTFSGGAMEVAEGIDRIFAEVPGRVNKEYVKNPENAGKSIKRRVREVNELAENEIHERMGEFLGSKGLSYGKDKLMSMSLVEFGGRRLLVSEDDVKQAYEKYAPETASVSGAAEKTAAE